MSADDGERAVSPAKLGLEARQTAGSQACENGGRPQTGSVTAWTLEKGGAFLRSTWQQDFLDTEVKMFVRR